MYETGLPLTAVERGISRSALHAHTLSLFLPLTHPPLLFHTHMHAHTHTHTHTHTHIHRTCQIHVSFVRGLPLKHTISHCVASHRSHKVLRENNGLRHWTFLRVILLTTIEFVHVTFLIVTSHRHHHQALVKGFSLLKRCGQLALREH